MKISLLLKFLTTLTLMINCSSHNKEDALLKEAAAIHNQAVALAAQLEKELDVLSEDKMLLRDSVLAWRAALKRWESEAVEVPGYESHDNSHAHHSHKKESSIDLTADQMLSVQKEMKKQVEAIDARVHNN